MPFELTHKTRAMPASLAPRREKNGESDVPTCEGRTGMTTATMTRRVIRADGTNQDLPGPLSVHAVQQTIGAGNMDNVLLRHLGHPLWVMVLDDAGHDKGRPVNDEATKLYWANCRPGTTHQIRGDVVVVLDQDFD